MKKKALFLFLCLFLFFLKGEASHLSFKLCGGLSWINGGDFNQNIRGWRDYYRDRNKSPYSFNHDMDELKGLWGGRAELLYSFSSHFSLGIGVEFLAKQISGNMSWTLNQEESYFHSADIFGDISIEEESIQKPKYKIQAVPITLTLAYSFPVSKGLSFSLQAGAGYYFGSLKYIEVYNYTFDYSDDRNEKNTFTRFVDQYSSSGEYSEETTSRAIGFHGGASFELRISNRYSFIIEVLGRLVNFNDWEGQREDIYSWEHIWGSWIWGFNYDRGEEQDTEEGKLWLVDFYSNETGKNYPRLVFSEEEPSIYSDVREARINLNGLSLRIGFRIQI